MVFDKFYMIDKDILFENITKIDRQRHTVYHDAAITFFYNMQMWDEFIARYDTWKLEQKPMIKDMFTNGDKRDWKFSDITSIEINTRLARTSIGVVHYFDNERFKDFLTNYSLWQNSQPKQYEDGWYKANNEAGTVNVFKLKNNMIVHPRYVRDKPVNNIHDSCWENVEPIDPNSDEFYQILSKMF